MPSSKWRSRAFMVWLGSVSAPMPATLQHHNSQQLQERQVGPMERDQEFRPDRYGLSIAVIQYWRRTSRIGNNHHGRRVGVFARIGENSEIFVFKKLNFQRRHLQDLDHHPQSGTAEIDRFFQHSSTSSGGNTLGQGIQADPLPPISHSPVLGTGILAKSPRLIPILERTPMIGFPQNWGK